MDSESHSLRNAPCRRIICVDLAVPDTPDASWTYRRGGHFTRCTLFASYPVDPGLRGRKEAFAGTRNCKFSLNRLERRRAKQGFESNDQPLNARTRSKFRRPATHPAAHYKWIAGGCSLEGIQITGRASGCIR